MLDFLTRDTEKAISNFVDPFKKKQLSVIRLEIRPNGNPLHDYSRIVADIRFNAGPTSGTHTITGDDFSTVLKEIKEFVDNLPSV
jgi:hypothetical protein